MSKVYPFEDLSKLDPLLVRKFILITIFAGDEWIKNGRIFIKSPLKITFSSIQYVNNALYTHVSEELRHTHRDWAKRSFA
jgi:hypothetical protein